MSKQHFHDTHALLVRALADARKSAGLRQVEVAKRLGKPQSFISKMETGERRIDVVEFLLLCRAIGSDPLELLREFILTMPADTLD